MKQCGWTKFSWKREGRQVSLPSWLHTKSWFFSSSFLSSSVCTGPWNTTVSNNSNNVTLHCITDYRSTAEYSKSSKDIKKNFLLLLLLHSQHWEYYRFSINHTGSHSGSLWLVHAYCVSCSQHSPNRTRMSGSFESAWYDCMCALTRPGFTLSSERVIGNGVWTHVNSQGNIPSTGGSGEDQTPDAASRRTASQTQHQLN